MLSSRELEAPVRSNTLNIFWRMIGGGIRTCASLNGTSWKQWRTSNQVQIYVLVQREVLGLGNKMGLTFIYSIVQIWRFLWKISLLLEHQNCGVTVSGANSFHSHTLHDEVDIKSSTSASHAQMTQSDATFRTESLKIEVQLLLLGQGLEDGTRFSPPERNASTIRLYQGRLLRLKRQGNIYWKWCTFQSK